MDVETDTYLNSILAQAKNKGTPTTSQSSSRGDRMSDSQPRYSNVAPTLGSNSAKFQQEKQNNMNKKSAPVKKEIKRIAHSIEEFNTMFAQYEIVFINGKELHRDYTWWVGWIDILPSEETKGKVQVRIMKTKESTLLPISKIKKFDLEEAKRLLRKRYSDDAPLLLEDILQGIRDAIQSYVIVCDICKKQGDLLVCDGAKCTGVFHLACLPQHYEQQPNINSDESWLCNDCEELVDEIEILETPYSPNNYWKLLWKIKRQRPLVEHILRDLGLFKDARNIEIKLNGPSDHPQAAAVEREIANAEKELNATLELFNKKKTDHDPNVEEFGTLLTVEKYMREYNEVGIPGIVIERKKRLDSAPPRRRKRKRDEMSGSDNLDSKSRARQKRKMNQILSTLKDELDDEEDEKSSAPQGEEEEDGDFVQHQYDEMEDEEDISLDMMDYASQPKKEQKSAVNKVEANQFPMPQNNLHYPGMAHNATPDYGYQNQQVPAYNPNNTAMPPSLPTTNAQYRNVMPQHRFGAQGTNLNNQEQNQSQLYPAQPMIPFNNPFQFKSQANNNPGFNMPNFDSMRNNNYPPSNGSS